MTSTNFHSHISAALTQDIFTTKLGIKNLSIRSDSMALIFPQTIPPKDVEGGAFLAEDDASHQIQALVALTFLLWFL